jgi:hypothetical protein
MRRRERARSCERALPLIWRGIVDEFRTLLMTPDDDMRAVLRGVAIFLDSDQYQAEP